MYGARMPSIHKESVGPNPLHPKVKTGSNARAGSDKRHETNGLEKQERGHPQRHSKGRGQRHRDTSTPTLLRLKNDQIGKYWGSDVFVSPTLHRGQDCDMETNGRTKLRPFRSAYDAHKMDSPA